MTFNATTLLGERLPAFGFGAAPLGNLYRTVSDADAAQLLADAWDTGVRYFDSAPLYGFGLSERRLGEFLRSQPRDDYVLSTKVGRRLRPNAGDHPQRAYFIDADPYEPVFDYSYDGIMRAFEDSLTRLGTDRIDLLLMHDIGEATHGQDHAAQFRLAMDGGYRAMDELRRSGAVSAIGLGVNEWQVCAEAIACHQWDCMLLAGRYTLLGQEGFDFLNLCADTDIPVIAAGVFNSGILATGAGSAARFNYDIAPAPLIARVNHLNDICARHQVPLGAAAIQFVAAHPAVRSLIAGVGNTRELAQVCQWVVTAVPQSFWADLVSEGLLSADVPLPGNHSR